MEDFFEKVKEICSVLIGICIFICALLFVRCTPEKRNPVNDKIECFHCHGTGKKSLDLNNLPGIFKVFGMIKILNLSIVTGECKDCKGIGYVTPFKLNRSNDAYIGEKTKSSSVSHYEDGNSSHTNSGGYSGYYDNNYNYGNNYYESGNDNSYISSKTWHNCNACNGSGNCMKCHGAGRIFDYGEMSIVSKEKYEQRCPLCKGSGRCGGCDGAGGAEY